MERMGETKNDHETCETNEDKGPVRPTQPPILRLETFWVALGNQTVYCLGKNAGKS